MCHMTSQTGAEREPVTHFTQEKESGIEKAKRFISRIATAVPPPPPTEPES